MRYVFVTSERYAPDDSNWTLGLEGAHKLCNELATPNTALQGRVFCAWLSDGSSAPYDWLREPEDHPHAPYRLPGEDKGEVAVSFNQLTDGKTIPISAINVDEMGNELDIDVQFVWSNVSVAGKNLSEEDCKAWDWDYNVGDYTTKGRVGRTTKNDWTDCSNCALDDQTANCYQKLRFYCFEQSMEQEGFNKACLSK